MLALAGGIGGLVFGARPRRPAVSDRGAGPTVRLLLARQRRNRKLSEQLPNALDMMSVRCAPVTP